MKALYKLLPLYFSTSIFVGAFAKGALISIPFFICLLINFIYLILLFKTTKFNYKWLINILVYSFFLLSLYIYSPHTDKSTNHLLLYFIAFFLLFIGVRNSIFFIRKRYPQLTNILHKRIYYAVLITCIYTILEFLFKNYLNIDLNNYVPQFRRLDYNYIENGFYRARGFFDESGHLALFLETFGLIAVSYAKKISQFKFILCITIVTLALIVSFSAFGYVCLIFLIIVTPFFLLKKVSFTFKIIFFSCIFVLICFIFIIGIEYFDFFYLIIENKLNNSASMNDRSGRLESLIPMLNGINLFVGYGPGSYRLVSEDGIISLYGNILLNTGIVGLTIYIIFLIKQYSIIKKIDDKYYRWSYTFSFILPSIHFIFLDNFYYPFFWIMLSMSHLIVTNQNDKDFNNNRNLQCT